MRIQTLLLVGLVGLGVSCGSSHKKVNTDLSVDSTPTGELAENLRVVLSFSKPMVAEDLVDEPVTASPLTLSPAIDGVAKWQDQKTLVFVPSSTLPVSTNFVATVAKGTKALDGNELGASHTFEFFTERLTAELEVMGSEERATRDQLVKLLFNHEVPFVQIQQNCRYTDGKQSHAVKLAPDSAESPSKTYSVQPVAQLSLDSDWRVSCNTALRGSVGNVGLAERAEYGFRTYGPLKYIGISPEGTDIVPEEGMRLKMSFTNPLSPPYDIKISPEVPGFPKRCHSLGDAPPGVSCAAELEPRTGYTVTIAATQKDRFGQTLGKEKVIELHTTDAQPTISMESGYFVAELKRPVVPVWTRNVGHLEISALKVTPANFHKVRPAIDWWETSPADFSVAKLKPKTRKVSVTATKNKWAQYPIDPVELFSGKSGPGMYYVEVGSPEVKGYPFEGGGRQKLLVNFTDIGVVSKMSPSRGLVWATQLSTGKPLPGAKVSVRNGKGKVTWSGRTDAEGVAYTPGTSKLEGRKPRRAARPEDEEESFEEEEQASLQIYVSHKSDWTMVNPARQGGLSAWNFNVSMSYDSAPTKLRGFMHTDRGLYRPGEKVHIKGLARVTRLGSALQVPRNKKVTVEVEGPRGKTFHTARTRLSKFGGFWLDLDLPGDARLGDYRVVAKLEHGTFTRSFMVEEYRPATFEVDGKANKKRVIRRGSVKANISANYLYGAPVREGDVDIVVHSRPRRVSFPKWEGFQFLDERRYDSYYYQPDYSQELITEESVSLDDKGNASLAVSVSPSDISSDADLLVQASVTAPSNERISKTFTIPYFRSRRYFGIKSPGYFLGVKKKQRFQVIGVSPDGTIEDGSAKLKVTKRDWNCVWEDWGYRGSYQCQQNKQVVLEKTLQFSNGKPASFEFTPDSGGDYFIVVEGKKGREAAASMEVYAWGDGGGSWRSNDSLTFDVIADKKEYSVGDTATLILKTDLAKATGLVTIERDGVIEKRLMTLTPEVKHLKIPITDAHAPNIYVSVALVQGRMGKGNRGKPRMRMGLVNLPVRPENKALKVAVETERKDYRPGETVKATVKVTDHTGAPVSSEVSITAADEGVLSLIGFKTPNPTPTFYAPWGLGVSTATQYAYIRDIPGPNLERPATGGDGGPGSVRSRFVSTAVWKPGTVTNASGEATVTFQAPDNLTAFRVMAVAADGGHRFGSGDRRFTVSKPLQLHRALPRFLTRGDKLEGGVIVHNETGKAGTAKVKVTADSALTVAGDTQRSVKIKKGGRVPVLFPIEATRLGEGVLTFSVEMNGERDAVELKLPVFHPSPVLTKHVAHGATKDPKSIPLKLPGGAIASSAQVSISVDPYGLAGIENGLRDLVGYPYGCLEQTTSKVVPMIAARDLAETLNLEGLSGKKIEGFVNAGIAKIGRHQTAYGGFSLWPGGRPEAYYTAYALWGLYQAKQAGYRVDQDRISDGLDYLKGDGKRPDESTPYYNESGNLGSQAFALYIRAMLGDKDTQAAAGLLAMGDKMPVYGKGFLLQALAAGLGNKDKAVIALRDELSKLALAAATADMMISEIDGIGYYMSSDMRSTAIVLAALVKVDPKNAAIKPLVRTLMKRRRNSGYLNTQDNTYSLLALTSYARSVSAKAPSVTVQLGGQTLMSGPLSGKSRIKVVTAPMPAGDFSLDLRTRGEVHYNVDIRYRQTAKSLKAESNGLSITREYLDENDKPKTSFTVGDVVKVRLTSDLKSSVVHMMISDRLPAGLEGLNTRLATTASPSASLGGSYSYYGGFMEMRDERVDFSSEYNYGRKYVREYLARATSVGKFALPPSTIELMYEPGTNGRTALSHIEIKGK